MRRILLILALLIPSALLAQREYSPKFYLGAKGGATLSRMTFSPGVHQKWCKVLPWEYQRNMLKKIFLVFLLR